MTITKIIILMKPSFLFLMAIIAVFLVSSCKVGRFIIYNFADINDHKKFPSRAVAHDPDHVFYFAEAEKGRFPKAITLREQEYTFEQYLGDNETVAFLVIQNDTIQYENYWGKHDQASIVPSFSMSKSITSILIGQALDEGLIQSVDEPITHYIPELKKNGFDQVTIKHLLQMTSGLKYNEGYYNPFGDVATFYYGTNLRKAIRKMKLKQAPGLNFEYVSGNTQLLGLVLERALKDKTISAYLQEKLWQPLGMEYDASWSLDRKKNGLEKAFCCINARARDYAKIGRLYLHKGNWNGQQLVPASWVAQSTQQDTTAGSARYYQYQWWLPSQEGDFMAQGILGQYIYVHPAKNLIIVRLGRKQGKANWWRVFTTLAANY